MRFLSVLILFVFCHSCWASSTPVTADCLGRFSAKLVSLQGKLFFDPDGKGKWQSAHLDETLCEGSRLRVEAYSRASVLLPDNVVLRLDEGTVLTLNAIATNQPSMLELIKGFVHFISRTPKALQITSPIANAGPEGTEFAMSVNEHEAGLWVYEGAVSFFNQKGSVRLTPGQGAQAKIGQKPNIQITLSPHDAVSWALYYPPLFSDTWLTGTNQITLQAAVQAFHHGQGDEALFMLEAIPTTQQSAGFLKLHAAMLLSVGRVQLALHDIHRLLAQQPNDADALALQAIIALSQNNKEQAYRLAQQAVTLKPTAAVAYTALSYVEQSRFNLAQALLAAKQASQNAPNDAMVWARQAELELCQGLLAQSAHSAQQALTLDAGLARTQTVMGFTYLMRTDLSAAKQSFSEAIRFDSASPLARLGLGLTKIRAGDVPAGRKELEIAAILDPQNSLLRSYLGKAYYEEKRNALAQEQFNLAKHLDPNDPTPYFYDAIAKQTSNRTIDALHDIEQAKALNANRAVYRSQLMLDKDLAARSAAQGRIYHDLGFQRLGLLEGWKSLATDPANYSAHRLLADSYASQPRHEIARVSELLQAQLLQPLNMTPIQPQLAQSNILIIDGLGPSSLAFNEYNPLFTRNRHALQSSAIYGSNNTFGNDAVYSGLWNQLSYSLGQYHYETNGFRANNSINQNIYNAFVQANVSDSLNLQFEYRYETRDNGDLSIPFYPDNFSPFYQEHTDITSYRLGGRYAFTNASSLLGSFIYQSVDSREHDSIFVPFERESSQIRNGSIAEIQHIYQGTNINTVTGVGYTDQLVKFDNRILLFGKPLNEKFDRPDVKRANIYHYSTIQTTDNLDITLGLSYDYWHVNHVKNDDEDNGEQNIPGDIERQPVNPKIGMVWKPKPNATFRAAAFRSLNITRTSNQTLEPTQVAGFNQFFDDDNGTIAWRYGTGFDYQFNKKITAGIEYSQRDLDVPRGISAPLAWYERIGKAYLYFTPNDELALSAEYLYEQFNRQDYQEHADGRANYYATTHWLPLTIHMLHPSGFSLILRQSYVKQSGIFQVGDSLTPGDNEFYLVDLSVNYRLPRRYGMLSFGVKNLFDSRFLYQDINSTPSKTNENYFAPETTLFTQIKLAI